MFVYQCECCGYESSRRKKEGPDGRVLCGQCKDMRWCRDCETWVVNAGYFEERRQCFSCFEKEIIGVNEMDYG